MQRGDVAQLNCLGQRAGVMESVAGFRITQDGIDPDVLYMYACSL